MINWRKRGIILGIWVILITIVSGSQSMFDFLSVFGILCLIPAGLATYWLLAEEKMQEPPEMTEMRQDLVEIEDVIKGMEETIEEQLTVIREYESIFDDQLTEINCVCGSLAFKGLIKPNDDNIIKCNNCKNDFKVTLTYDTVQIFQPMDTNEIDDKLTLVSEAKV